MIELFSLRGGLSGISDTVSIVVWLNLKLAERSVQERAAELYSTAVPTEFEPKFHCLVRDVRAAEQELMQLLQAYRCTQAREFFRAPVEVAIRHALVICTKYSI
ncbi:MAG: GIY-YIG nuclease family protein [Pedosphaera sp.]|nr:GIY-YIG nuclease family protein [Pedosphaera sp.]